LLGLTQPPTLSGTENE